MKRGKTLVAMLVAVALLLSAAEIPGLNFQKERQAAAASTTDSEIEHYLTPYQNIDMKLYKNDITQSFTMMDQTYYQGITTNGGYGGDTEALYNLDACIERMTFSVGHLDNDDASSATLYVYADDTPIQTVALTSGMVTREISLDVSGIRQLKLRCEHGGNYPRYGIADVKGYGSHLYDGKIMRESTMQQGGLIQYTCTECGDSYNAPLPLQTECIPYLEPYQTLDMDIYSGSEEKSFSMLGRKYYIGMKTNGGYGGDTEALYNLDQRFDRVKFTVGHLDNDNNSNATLYIYGDDVLLQSLDLQYDMQVQEVTLNVEGVRQLKIQCEHGGNYPRYGIVNMKGYGGHLYEEELMKIATAQQDGSRKYTCSCCGDSYTEVISAQTDCIPYLQPYQTTNMSLYDSEEGKYFMVMGERYDRGMKTDGGYGSDAEALYNLSKQYTSVSFTVGHCDNDDRSAATLYIYCDGVKMREIALKTTMISQVVTVDTQNVAQLQIKVGHVGNYPRYAIYDMEYERSQALTHSFQLEQDEETGIARYVCEHCGAFYTGEQTQPTEEPDASKAPGEETEFPTAQPTEVPTEEPDGPTWQPSEEPTIEPEESMKPSAAPSAHATKKPGTGSSSSLPTPTTNYNNISTNAKVTASKKNSTAPARTYITKIKKKRRGTVVIKYSKIKGADGYEMQYSRKRSFSKKQKSISSTSSNTLFLSPKKKYYIRVRAYKYGWRNGQYVKLTGKWSPIRKVKTKK